MFRLTTDQRRLIYLQIAKNFFDGVNIGFGYICNNLLFACREVDSDFNKFTEGKDSENKIFDIFPEFDLFRPIDLCDGEVWWNADPLSEEIRMEKAMVLLFCAELCEEKELPESLEVSE